MKHIKEYISEFNNAFKINKIDAFKISIAEFNPPSDFELLNYANIYHYGINENKNLLLAYEFYAYAHHKNGDVQFTKPVTPVSIMQYIELAREIEAGPDESMKIFGLEEAGDYYMWESDLLAVAIKYEYTWTACYLLEEIVNTIKLNREERYELTYNRHPEADLYKIFEEWDYLKDFIKKGY
jgi:hypothetical protein